MLEPDVWPNDVPVSERGGPHFPALVTATRIVQDRVSGTRAPSDVVAEAAAGLTAVAALLAPFDAGALEAVAGTRLDLPGRGHPFLPGFVAQEWTDERVSGHVTFTRIHDSGGGAAHGGALPLLFVEVLGRLANTGRSPGRTAYVHTNFRHSTPIGRELHLEATVDKIEGRKRFLSGRLSEGTTIVSEAEALFVALQTEQS